MGRLSVIVVWGCFLASSCGPPCSRDERKGTYEATYYEKPGGTCGPVATEVAHLHPDDVPPHGCEWPYSEWSDDECSLSRTAVCARDGLLIKMQGASSHEDGGETIKGTVMMEVEDLATGQHVCRSTYDMTARRL